MVYKKKNSLFVWGWDKKIHPLAQLVMPIGDPRDGFFYPSLTLMIDSYTLKWVKATEIPIWAQNYNASLKLRTTKVKYRYFNIFIVNNLPEVSSTTRVLASARCSGTYLYS